MTGTHPITFVCCVESGPLEVQTVRMIESLRRWGGKFANAPMIAVTPRFGPPLTHATQAAFDRLQVQHLRFQSHNQYIWFNFINKPSALLAAEQHSTTEAICWLDSDLLIVGEPSELILQPGEDFLACASDKNIGTAGADDPFDRFWQEIGRSVGINVDDLPWVTTEQEHQKIRLYWNGGILVYRRSTGYAKDYLHMCEQMLDAQMIDHNSAEIGTGAFAHEQIAVGLSMFRMGLSWRALPYSHDYIMSSRSHQECYQEELLRSAKIIHYHDSMWHWFWAEFIQCLKNTHPEVADWLAPLGSLTHPAPWHYRVMGKALKTKRKRQEAAYVEACRVV
ncbi:MAG: hypothetical protein KME11_15250 [Timaviella obliquedivisa GSE-PSE-MK23-08B]|nr:hypothetical protein [Timaviella obliquedivisa GSE-PSE-MK23-08B]